ncbi:hypothetical protein SAMN02910317_03182 [Ruminococcaceae bacterium FB2012]|nr:hypothetical protein SAMN02910317_03182 [Ruminococcaceae bacterium FB2012]
MAKNKCRDCGNVFSDSISTCPKCFSEDVERLTEVFDEKQNEPISSNQNTHSLSESRKLFSKGSKVFIIASMSFLGVIILIVMLNKGNNNSTSVQHSSSSNSSVQTTASNYNPTSITTAQNAKETITASENFDSSTESETIDNNSNNELQEWILVKERVKNNPNEYFGKKFILREAWVRYNADYAARKGYNLKSTPQKGEQHLLTVVQDGETVTDDNFLKRADGVLYEPYMFKSLHKRVINLYNDQGPLPYIITNYIVVKCVPNYLGNSDFNLELCEYQL